MKTAFGIDLGGTNTRVALVADDGHILAIEKRKTPVAEGPQATAQMMADMIQLLRKEYNPQYIVGVGVGSPGPLSREKRMIFQTPNLPGFDGYALGAEVEKLSGLRTWLDNDAKCATFGEGHFGGAKGLKHYLLLTFGTGIGGGVVVDGQMIYGKSDGACELGHATLYPEGRLCKCGNRGCFEQYASATAIERRASEHAGSPANARDLLDACARKESWALKCLNEVTTDIAIACASFVNVFDPEAIVLGGGVFTTGGGPIASTVQEKIKDRCFASSQKDLRICASTLGGDAGVLGAASLAFRA